MEMSCRRSRQAETRTTETRQGMRGGTDGNGWPNEDLWVHVPHMDINGSYTVNHQNLGGSVLLELLEIDSFKVSRACVGPGGRNMFTADVAGVFLLQMIFHPQVSEEILEDSMAISGS